MVDLEQKPAIYAENLPLADCYGTGHWTQAKVETFGAPPTHAHCYTESLEQAKSWLDLLGKRLPSILKTFSISEK